jgi:septal ring factor EnvC (AmiA/AmiB activator)
MNTTPTPAADVMKAAALLDERAQVLRHMRRDDLFVVEFKDDRRDKQWRRDLAEVASQVRQIAETMRKSALEKRIRDIDVELAAMGVEIPAAEKAQNCDVMSGQGIAQGTGFYTLSPHRFAEG